MPVQRRDHSRAHLWSLANRSTAVLSVAIGTLLVLVGSAIYFAWQWANSRDAYGEQAVIVHSLEALQPDRRMQLAGEILQMRDNGIVLTALNNKSFQVMVEYVSRNGSQPWTTTAPLGWHTYFLDWVPAILQVGIVLSSLACSVSYIRHTQKSRHYLADLPWRELWLWASVLVLPLLWIPLAVSAVRMRINPPRATGKRPPKRRRFAKDMDGARKVYTKMRTEGTSKGLALLVKRTDQELAAAESTCVELAEEIQEAQAAHLRLKAESARLHEAASKPIVMPTQEALEHEFNRLMQLPGVLGVRPVGTDGIAIHVAASIAYGLDHYNLGTWEIRLYLKGCIETTELESGVLPDWKRRDPVYRAGDEFCFGEFKEPIISHLTCGEILEAATLAVRAVNNVNVSDKPNIPQAFRRISRINKEETA